MRKFAIIVLVLMGALAGLYKWNFPTASYRYRLSIAVETDGQVHAGSSVIEVRYRFNPQFLHPIFGMYEITVKGQAAVVDLGTRGVLVAALVGNSDPSTESAAFLAARAFQPSAQQANGWYGATLDRVRELSQMRDAIPLAPNNMPPFIWFSDPADPVTGHSVRPNDFATVIGDSTRLLSAQVEISHAPILIDINKRLPLYDKRPLRKDSTSWIGRDGSLLNWSMFVALGSVP